MTIHRTISKQAVDDAEALCRERGVGVVSEVVDYALATARHSDGEIQEGDFLARVRRVLDTDGAIVYTDAGPTLVSIRPTGDRDKAIEILDDLARSPEVARVVWIHGHP